MKIEITEDEILQLSKAFLLAANHSQANEINWEIVSKFLSKIDNPQFK